MVERTENKGLEEFEGIVEKVDCEEGVENRKQYHITIEPTSIKVGGATGRLHEWVPMSPKATEEAVPQGSVMDRYLTQIEICVSEAKKAKTIEDAFKLLIGKKFKFKKLKLGKDFDGHSAREYSVPVMVIN